LPDAPADDGGAFICDVNCDRNFATDFKPTNFSFVNQSPPYFQQQFNNIAQNPTTLQTGNYENIVQNQRIHAMPSLQTGNQPMHTRNVMHSNVVEANR
jgi:hypothetical protein